MSRRTGEWGGCWDQKEVKGSHHYGEIIGFQRQVHGAPARNLSSLVARDQKERGRERRGDAGGLIGEVLNTIYSRN
jgi:hypothetical protein